MNSLNLYNISKKVGTVTLPLLQMWSELQGAWPVWWDSGEQHSYVLVPIAILLGALSGLGWRLWHCGLPRKQT